MMAHSTLNRGVMFDWIRYNQEQGLPDPTDEEIVDRFCFHSVEQSRTLLAELVDKGLIHIVRENGRRISIGLGRANGHTLPPVKILPTPHHPNPRPASPERRALIAAAAEKVANRPKTTNAERPEVETVEAQRGGHRNGHSRPVSVDQGPRPERPPSQAAEETIAPMKASPRPVEARHPVPPNTRYSFKPTRRMSCSPLIATADVIQHRANKAGVSVNQWLGKWLDEALTAEQGEKDAPPSLARADVGLTVRSLVRRDRDAVEVLTLTTAALAPWIMPKGKPMITADVMRAAANQGMPLDAFIEHLIDLGMRQYRVPAAEAAE